MGTHPIFESDFDCLTENGQKIKDGFAIHQAGQDVHGRGAQGHCCGP